MNQPVTSRVTCERHGHVLLIGLDRVAKRNAFDLDLLNALSLAYGKFEADSEARVAVVFGHGEHFTAGLDLVNASAALAEGWQAPPGGCDPWGVFAGPRVSKPVIVAAQGYCLTIGIELMLAADINLCASNTRFAQKEVQRGIFPFGGATLRLHQVAGWGNAMRWLLTGDEFDAREAYRMGLVQEVVERGRHLERALALAETVAKQAPLGVQATLASARQAVNEGPEAAARALLPRLLELVGTEDAAEGVQSFLERREARFTGK